MLELRWVERSEPAPQYGPNVAQTVRVLQYRVPADTGGVWMVNPDDRMTPWTDVPVVTQEKAK